MGPYSRFEWSHPGPLLFYLLLLPYMLAQYSSQALYLTAGVINLTAAIAALWLVRRLTASSITRVLLLLIWAAFLATPRYYPHSFTSIWNPVIVSLPFALLGLLCFRLANGGWGVLPAVVLLHSLVVQTHIAYLPAASLAVIVALILSYGDQLRRHQSKDFLKQHSRPLIISTVVLLAVWALPLADQAFGQQNLSALYRFFVSQAPQQAVADSLAHACIGLSEPLLTLLKALRIPLPPGAPVFLTITLAGLLIAGCLKARRERHPVAATGCALALCQVAVAPLIIMSIRGPIHGHLLLWLPVVGAMSWMAVALAHTSEGLRSRGFYIVPIIVCGLLIGVISGVHVSRIRQGFQTGRRDASSRAPTLRAGAMTVRSFQHEEDGPILLAIGSHDTWGWVAGVLLQLGREGTAPLLEPSWRFMFGQGFQYANSAPSELGVFDRRVRAGKLLLKTGDWYLHQMRSVRESIGKANTIGGAGVFGNAEMATDGASAAEGSSWNGPQSVIFRDESSYLVVKFLASRVTGLTISADHNDTYRIACSSDEITFVELGYLETVPSTGMRTRRFFFDRGQAWRLCRISPAAGDGLYSVSEIAPIVEDAL